MVLGAGLRTVMSSIIRWRKAEILPAGGIEYAEGLVLLIASNGTGKRRPTPSWRSSNQVSVRLAGRGKRTPGPGQRRANPTGRVSTFVLNAAIQQSESNRSLWTRPSGGEGVDVLLTRTKELQK